MGLVPYFEGETAGTGIVKSMEYKITKIISHFFAVAGIGFPVTQREENLRERKGREERHCGVTLFKKLTGTHIIEVICFLFN